MILEVCTPNYQSAKNAYYADAHRIELCEKLEVGGITPSYDLIKKVREILSIKTYVLVRPRSGNFVYDEDEFETMKADIQFCKKLGCDGIVSGVLNEDNTIDIARTRELIALSKPLEFTFHRAFDDVVDPMESMEQLIELGADRILTSGQKASAEEGIELLKLLKEKAKDRIVIMPGAGINPDNAPLFKDLRFREIHASASKHIDSELTSEVSTIKAILDAVQK